MIFYILLCLASEVFGDGVKYIKKGLMLKWKFLPEEEIQFQLYIPQVIADDLGWAGIGFKYPEDDRYMTNADMVNIIFGESIYDCIALSNGSLTLDTDVNGTNDLVVDPTIYDDIHVIFTWRRKLITDDPNDIIFIKGNEYNLLWAIGIMKNGNQLKHFKSGRGFESIVLSDDYFDNSVIGVENDSFLSDD
ncbi:unnamed protein product [Blepharisma stoltei]|uniref:DOMON domain-containing protein n=1 Tax=Blepharisma stoltei TaxID=1481888 RepID=A0AAU9II28_9CILI|nr:unnamed protein product [Blepharisma stoltei]